MRVQLLGTGASAGWPNPWCGCASCRAAAAAGQVRGQTSALVDGRLLLDIGPDAPRAAVRLGHSLAAVRAVLVTHAHPDHHGWPAWMWRGWAAGAGPLTLVAPPAVLAAAAEHLDARVTPVPAEAGRPVEVAGYLVRPLPAAHGDDGAGPAVLYDLTGPDGTRLLWGTDTGPLPAATMEALAGADLHLVLLELTGTAGSGDHLDLTSWPAQVAALRRCGAVTARTALRAVHLGHDNPPPDELDRLLAGWGARAGRDGEVLTLGAGGPPAAPARGRTLVLGGARSGKSAHAEALLAAEPDVVYVATAGPRPEDPEWAARIAAHRRRRPAAWTTRETRDVAGLLAGVGPAALLVDDLGLWLTGLLDDTGGWDGGDPPAVRAACDALVAGWAAYPGRAVLVAPEVGAGVVPASAAGRLFRDRLGALTAALAAGSDEVVQVVAGLPRRLR